MWRLAPMKWKFCFVSYSSSQGHSWSSQLDGVHGAANEDPDLRDNSQDPGDGMPAQPCEQIYILLLLLLLLISSMSLILLPLMVAWDDIQDSGDVWAIAWPPKQDSLGWITLTCPNTQSFTGWPVQLHTKGGDPTAKGERNGGTSQNKTPKKKLGKMKNSSWTGRHHGDLLAGGEEGGVEGRIIEDEEKDDDDKTRTLTV